jgi:hypothetical protein
MSNLHNRLNEILDKMKCIGDDMLCVPEISIHNLEKIFNLGIKLKKIYFLSQKESFRNTIFIFENNTYYAASGFSMGYKGKSPKNLIKIINLWFPEQFENETLENVFYTLDSFKNWEWDPMNEFVEIKEQI